MQNKNESHVEAATDIQKDQRWKVQFHTKETLQ